MPNRIPRTHIFIIDGTFSRVEEGHETNAGLTYKLLSEVGPSMEQSVGYHPGIQGTGWKRFINAAAGVGINDSICTAYSALCSRYMPGDRVVLLGYSRGAYAVRSLAGWIGRVGLLKAEHATARRVLRAFRYYEAGQMSDKASRFSELFCHQDVRIEMLGVWDTVRALGLPYPLVNRLAPMVTDFHDHQISDHVCHAFQALALDERRISYKPVIWNPRAEWPGKIEQVWFAGTHADVGGHVWMRREARQLSNIPLVWMLERLERCGVELPEDWRDRFPQDPLSPSVGQWTGTAKFFLVRAPRLVQLGRAQSIHHSVSIRQFQRPGYKSRAAITTLTAENQTVSPAPLVTPQPSE